MAEFAVLSVRLHGATIGTLTLLPGDQTLFAFAQDYLEYEERATLSLSFKDRFGALIARSKPVQTRLPPFFSNLLPEGPLREYLARRAGVRTSREFHLAWVLGSDLPGAIELLPTNLGGLPSNDATDKAGISGLPIADEAGVLRFSLAGVQLKFSAIKSAKGGLTIPADGFGGSWIVKLPSTAHPGVPENEYAMMELARAIGIEVPETMLLPVAAVKGLPAGIEIAGKSVFATKRFDRTETGPVHIEDFAQVFGIFPERKYDRASYRNIAEVIWAEAGERGIEEFVRRFVFNALIGNGDMHMKNWSLIYRDRRHPQLAPAYDFVSTIAYMPNESMALTFVDSKRFESLTLEQFRRFADKARLPAHLVLNNVKQTVAAFRDAWTKAAVEVDERTGSAIVNHLKKIPIYQA